MLTEVIELEQQCLNHLYIRGSGIFVLPPILWCLMLAMAESYGWSVVREREGWILEERILESSFHASIKE